MQDFSRIYSTRNSENSETCKIIISLNAISLKVFIEYVKIYIYISTLISKLRYNYFLNNGYIIFKNLF